jgi:hypothetical protein
VFAFGAPLGSIDDAFETVDIEGNNQERGIGNNYYCFNIIYKYLEEEVVAAFIREMCVNERL